MNGRTDVSITVTVISDTHLRHRELNLLGGDLLIHCGDMFNLGTVDQSVLAELDAWFGVQEYDQVLCVGGNHDHALEAALQYNPQPFRNAHHLQDATYGYKGLNLYGTPWVPNLPSHAFSLDDAGLARAWSKIPDATDILITHTPPFGTLDKSSLGHSHGCPDLSKELQRIMPKVHCFGHVHAGAGSIRIRDTKFINASSIESGTGRVLPPISFEIAAGGVI